jgi:hypothetical protein
LPALLALQLGVSAASPAPHPCGTPLTMPQPLLALDRSASGIVASKAMLTLTVEGSSGFGFLRTVELVPERGAVIELPTSRGRSPSPDRLVFDLPFRRLVAGQDFRIVVVVDDVDAPADCPIVHRDVLGSIVF